MTARASKSLVVQRLEPWIGMPVFARLTWEPTSIIARLVAVLPIGREYFLELDAATLEAES